MEYSSVLVTFPDRECAEKIAGCVLDRKLAACVNMFEIKSMYRWDESIQKEKETAALFKIKSVDFKEISEFIKSIHPYEVPCIVKYNISEGYLPYLNWIKESTDRNQQ